jgi:hypothetical protein
MVSTIRVRRPDVIDEVFDGEAVLVNLATGTYFALNADATRVWTALAGDHGVDGVIAAVAAESGIAADDDLRATVTGFLAELQGHGLVEADGELPAAEAPAAGALAPALQVFTDMEDLLLLDPIHDIDVDGTGWPQAPAPTA